MEIIYGTSNKGKVEEVKKIIRYHDFDAKIYTIKDIGFDQEIIEDGTTFEENSLIKAMAIKKYCEENNILDKIIFTDDAGLCVDVLNGEPGIHSARYAGKNATQEENIGKLLDKLKEYKTKEERKCEFVCVLTAIMPDGKKIVSRGERKGSIAFKPRKNGRKAYLYTSIYSRWIFKTYRRYERRRTQLSR